ncbi:MAG TPA: cation:dicarboxylase symporter family transporter [Terracidiphilus sp.]|jgi:proton glutamate symport protein
MTEATPPAVDQSRSPLLITLAVAASLLYAAGVVAAVTHAPAAIGTGMRGAAMALLIPVALRRRSLLVWTFFAMLAGAELGADAPALAAQTRFLGDIFLRLIRLIVAPLIFGGIVTGIAGHNELRSVGRVALKSLVFFEVVTTFGLLLGAVAIDLTQAGAGVTLPAIVQAVAPAAHPETWQQILVNIFPENIAKAVADNQILQVAVFALLFGAALAMLPEAKRAPMVNVLQSLTETMFSLTRIIMVTAPIAAGAALAYTVGSMGLATLLPLGKLLVTCYATLCIFLVVLALILLFARIPLGRFAAAVAEPAALGFATTSSEAALPLAMERMEEFGVPRWIVSFVIPTGYSFNMTGSSIYLSMAALFAAQAAGLHLTVIQQIVLLATLMLTSKGIAGVPRATLVILMAVASSFQIPASAVLMLLGIDTLMDMGRTAMNVIGNCLAAAVVARWEGELKSQAAPE